MNRREAENENGVRVLYYEFDDEGSDSTDHDDAERDG